MAIVPLALLLGGCAVLAKTKAKGSDAGGVGNAAITIGDIRMDGGTGALVAAAIIAVILFAVLWPSPVQGYLHDRKCDKLRNGHKVPDTEPRARDPTT